MKFFVTPEKKIVMEEIPPLLAEWISDIPRLIVEGSQSPSVEARFFPAPAREEEVCEDWKTLVQPELYTWFDNARSLVSEDVKTMQQTGGNFSFSFPFSHSESWINALNQTRLVLAETHHLTEKELGEDRQLPAEPIKELLLLQMDFYAQIQYYLVELMESVS